MPKCHCPDSCEEPAEPLSTHRDRPGTAPRGPAATPRLSRADGSAETAVADPWAGLIPPEGGLGTRRGPVRLPASGSSPPPASPSAPRRPHGARPGSGGRAGGGGGGGRCGAALNLPAKAGASGAGAPPRLSPSGGRHHNHNRRRHHHHHHHHQRATSGPLRAGSAPAPCPPPARHGRPRSRAAGQSRGQRRGLAAGPQRPVRGARRLPEPRPPPLRRGDAPRPRRGSRRLDRQPPWCPCGPSSCSRASCCSS